MIDKAAEIAINTRCVFGVRPGNNYPQWMELLFSAQGIIRKDPSNVFLQYQVMRTAQKCLISVPVYIDDLN